MKSAKAVKISHLDLAEKNILQGNCNDLPQGMIEVISAAGRQK